MDIGYALIRAFFALVMADASAEGVLGVYRWRIALWMAGPGALTSKSSVDEVRAALASATAGRDIRSVRCISSSDDREVSRCLVSLLDEPERG